MTCFAQFPGEHSPPSTSGRSTSKTAPENSPRLRSRLTPAAGPKPIFPSHDATPPLRRSRLPPHPPSNERRGSRSLTHVGGRQRRTATALFRHRLSQKVHFFRTPTHYSHDGGKGDHVKKNNRWVYKQRLDFGRGRPGSPLQKRGGMMGSEQNGEAFVGGHLPGPVEEWQPLPQDATDPRP